MHLNVNGWRVMYHAIESLSHRAEEERPGVVGHYLVIRTVSGNEHRRPVKDKETADKAIEAILERMAISDAL